MEDSFSYSLEFEEKPNTIICKTNLFKFFKPLLREPDNDVQQKHLKQSSRDIVSDNKNINGDDMTSQNENEHDESHTGYPEFEI